MFNCCPANDTNTLATAGRGGLRFNRVVQVLFRREAQRRYRAHAQRSTLNRLKRPCKRVLILCMSMGAAQPKPMTAG